MAVLRASARHAGSELDYAAVTAGAEAGDTGVPHGDLLIAFAEAVVGGDDAALDAARGALADAMGGAALVDSAGVAGLFNAIDRVADSTGTPLEDSKAAETADIRAAIGIDAFVGGGGAQAS